MSENTLNQATSTNEFSSVTATSTPAQVETVSAIAHVADDKKKEKAKKKDDLGGLEVLQFPNRTLPAIIEELLEKDFPVRLAKDGYYVGGFYGLNAETGNKGFAFGQDTSEANTLVFYDSKNHKHVIKSFEDLVKFHNHVWGLFYKTAKEYQKPDTSWFSYMLEYGVLSITPGGK
jgi:hypothetical protein